MHRNRIYWHLNVLLLYTCSDADMFPKIHCLLFALGCYALACLAVHIALQSAVVIV